MVTLCRFARFMPSRPRLRLRAAGPKRQFCGGTCQLPFGLSNARLDLWPRQHSSTSREMTLRTKATQMNPCARTALLLISFCVFSMAFSARADSIPIPVADDPEDGSTLQGLEDLPSPDNPFDSPTKKVSEPMFGPFMHIGLMPNYSFRTHPDGRSHGLGAQLYAGFAIADKVSIQIQALGMAFNAVDEASEGLSLFGTASTLLYHIEEGGFIAEFGFGPVAAASIQWNEQGEIEVAPWMGGLFQFGVGIPMGTATRISLSARCPLFVFGKGKNLLDFPLSVGPEQNLFPFQVSMGVGLVIEPWRIIGGLQNGDDPFELIFPSF
jgi:hypothetical protein